jgi:hypothetical protein
MANRLPKRLPKGWYTTKVYIGCESNYQHVKDNIAFIDYIEVMPLEITGDDLKNVDYDLWSSTPNAWGVYVRYKMEVVDTHNLNPSEWLADFNNESAANAMKMLLEAFLNKNE